LNQQLNLSRRLRELIAWIQYGRKTFCRLLLLNLLLSLLLQALPLYSLNVLMQRNPYILT